MGNEEVLRIPQSPSVIKASPWNDLISYPGRYLVGGLSPNRDEAGVFYSPSRLAKYLEIKSNYLRGKKERKIERKKEKENIIKNVHNSGNI